MNSKIFRNPIISIGILLIISGILSATVSELLTTALEVILKFILPNFSGQISSFWASLFGTIFFSILGFTIKEHSAQIIETSLRTFKQDLNDQFVKLARQASDSDYSLFLGNVRDASVLRKLHQRFSDLPLKPTTLQIIASEYGTHADKHIYFMRFSSFLELATSLTQNSKRVFTINPTPPYEWWCPLFNSPDSTDLIVVNLAFENYKNCIEIYRDDPNNSLNRLTIVDDIKALTSGLEHGIITYFNKRNIELSPEIDTDEFARPLIQWIHNIIRRFQLELTIKSQDVAKRVLEITNDANQNAINNFISSLFGK